VADAEGGLSVLDISSLPQYTLLGTVYTPNSSRLVAADDNLAFVVEHDENMLQVVDVSDPVTPLILGSSEISPPYALQTGLETQDGYVYLVSQNGGFQVFDVGDPANPGFLADFTDLDGAEGLAVAENRAYISELGTYRVSILDITDPAQPFLLARFPINSHTEDLEIRGQELYLASGAGIFIYDVTDPAQVSLLGHLDSAFSAYRILVGPTEVVFSKTIGGLWLAPLNCAEITGMGNSANLLPKPAGLNLNAYPNPFNPRTIISFELPAAAKTQLDIYNLAGRYIQTLIAGEDLPPGPAEIVWSGRDGGGRNVPSGVYFYRLKAGSHVETKSMTLIR